MISRKKVSNFIPVKVYTTNNISNFKRDIAKANIYDKLTKDNPNDNYNILNEIITTILKRTSQLIRFGTSTNIKNQIG